MAADTLPIMGRPKKSEPSEPIRAPRSFVAKVRRLALQAKMDPGDWLASEFGSAVDRKHVKLLEDLMAQEKKADK